MQTMLSHLLRSVISFSAVTLWLSTNNPPLFAQAPQAGSGPIDYKGFVRVVEADSYEIWPNGHQTSIGLMGITVPQGNTQCGKQATAAAQALVKDGIRLEEHPGVG